METAIAHFGIATDDQFRYSAMYNSTIPQFQKSAGVCPQSLLSDVLQRMMMYGVERDDLTGCDITAGSVHGIWYTLQQSDYIWHAFGAPVGFFDTELEITPMQTE